MRWDIVRRSSARICCVYLCLCVSKPMWTNLGGCPAPYRGYGTPVNDWDKEAEPGYGSFIDKDSPWSQQPDGESTWGWGIHVTYEEGDVVSVNGLVFQCKVIKGEEKK